MRLEGGNPDLTTAIREHRWQELTGLTERERALCTIAEKLSATPTQMSEADWQPLRNLGFDDRACLEAAHLVGYFNYMTRLADGFGLQPGETSYGTPEAGS